MSTFGITQINIEIKIRSGVTNGQAILGKGIGIRGWKDRDLCYTTAN